MSEAPPEPHVDILADCHALQIGEVRVKSGDSRAFRIFPAAAAFVFHEGKGTINIAGCSHDIWPGRVEIVCPGEACAISAAQDVRVFLVVCKDEDVES